MPRVKNSVASRRRRKKVLKAARGQFGGRHKLFRTAQESVNKGMLYAYRDRKVRKREIRGLWIVRINAGARLHGLSYSRMMDGLKKAGITLDRKVLADLAVSDDKAFSTLAERAKQSL